MRTSIAPGVAAATRDEAPREVTAVQDAQGPGARGSLLGAGPSASLTRPMLALGRLPHGSKIQTAASSSARAARARADLARRLRCGVVASLAALLLCPGPLAAQGKKQRKYAEAQARAGFSRDWARFPAIVERTTSAEIVALGDVHGAHARLIALLVKAGLIRAEAGVPAGYAWDGGSRVLVCVGDLIDKGDHSIPVLDLVMSLERQAAAAGGEVIVTLGNHEAEFLAKPWRSKASDFNVELKALGLDAKAVAASSPYGEWMKSRPLAASVNGWFFAHSGRSSRQTATQLAQRYRTAVDAGTWDAPFLLGGDSILVDQKWWKDRADVEASLQALGAAHIVFGHDPGAARSASDGERGAIREKYKGRIFAIDVGMSPAIDDSEGALLLIDRRGSEDIATSLDARGTKRELWHGPAAAPAKP
jgi:hypothetical protein